MGTSMMTTFGGFLTCLKRANEIVIGCNDGKGNRNYKTTRIKADKKVKGMGAEHLKL